MGLFSKNTTKENQDMAKALLDLTNRIVELSTEKDNLRTSLANRENDVVELLTQITSLNEEKRKTQELLADNSKQINSLLDEKQKLIKQVAQLKEDLETEQFESAAYIDSLKAASMVQHEDKFNGKSIKYSGYPIEVFQNAVDTAKKSAERAERKAKEKSKNEEDFSIIDPFSGFMGFDDVVGQLDNLSIYKPKEEEPKQEHKEETRVTIKTKRVEFIVDAKVYKKFISSCKKYGFDWEHALSKCMENVCDRKYYHTKFKKAANQPSKGNQSPAKIEISINAAVNDYFQEVCEGLNISSGAILNLAMNEFNSVQHFRLLCIK